MEQGRDPAKSFPEPNVFSPAEKRAVEGRWTSLAAEIRAWSIRR